jgi:peptidoglycan/LPS O-acetylase OafA/YrhL
MALNTTGTAVPRSRLANGLSQRKIPSLDGLRAVAVILVIFNHLKVPFAPEGRGVLTFFVLSGFLITWMMINESEKKDSISIRNFYVRRVLRIFPAFYVFVAVAFVSRSLTQGWPSGSMLRDYLSAVTYTSNYRFALLPHVDHTCWHTWALSIEEQFYLLWPWVFVAFQKDLRKLTHLLIAAIVLVDIYRMVLFFKFHVDDHWLSYTFDSRVDHLLVGCLLAVLLKRGVLMRFWNLLTDRVSVSLLPFGLIVLSIALGFRFHFGYKFAVGFVVDPLLTALFMVQVIALGNTWLWGWLNWRVVRYMGQISYGMFLYHMMVNRLVLDLFGQHSLWIHVPAVVGGAALVGACSFHVIERRFLQLKSRFTGNSAKQPSAAPAQDYQLAS